MSVRLIVAEQSHKTGRILSDALREKGMRVVANGEDAIVSYGVRIGPTRVPVLNAQAGMADKYGQLTDLLHAGIRVPPVYGVSPNCSFPMLARKRAHRAGRDIMPVFQQEELAWRRAAGAHYFVEFIPRAAEYRIWAFRGNHLGTYEKVMARPAEYRRIGWNYHNGFVFQLVNSERVPRGAVEQAGDSLKALRLDFGAVDVLQGKDGKFYVLEVNTAPGVEDGRRQVIQGLADKIVAWSRNGFPERRIRE